MNGTLNTKQPGVCQGLWLVCVFSLLTFTLIKSGLSHAADDKQQPVQKLERGIFLISNRNISDPRFKQSVILITKHDTTGSVGLIINKPTTIPVSHALTEVEKRKNIPEYMQFGGPVQFRSLLTILLHTERNPKGVWPFLDQVYIAAGFANINGIVMDTEPSDQMKIYAGYAGWVRGQLHAEVARGNWHLKKADTHTLFRTDTENIWPEMIRSIEQEASRKWVLKERVPESNIL